LRELLGRPFAPTQNIAIDFHGNDKNFGMVGPCGFDHLVTGWVLEALLRVVLQLRLPVAVGLPTDLLDARTQLVEEEAASRRQAPVQIESAHHRFENIGDIARKARKDRTMLIVFPRKELRSFQRWIPKAVIRKFETFGPWAVIV